MKRPREPSNNSAIKSQVERLVPQHTLLNAQYTLKGYETSFYKIYRLFIPSMGGFYHT